MVIRRDVVDGFLAADITCRKRWVKVDGTSGVMFFPLEYVECKNGLFDFELIYFGRVDSHEVIDGFGARLSAPGYLDCTDWFVFDTEQGAIDFLKDKFGKEEEESG